MKFVIEGRGLTAGGGKVGVLQILPAMAKQGHHEYVAYLPDMPEYAALDCAGLKVVLTRRSSNILVREYWLNASVRRVCRKEKADALLCLGNFAPHFPPIPTIIRLQNAYYVYRDAPSCRGLTFRERLIVKYGREHFHHLAGNVSVVVQTEVMKQHLLAESSVSASRVIVIPDRGMSFPDSPRECQSARRDATSPFTFLCVALCSPNKNLEVLVEAVKKVRTLSTRPFQCLLTIDPNQHPAARRLLARIEHEAIGDILINTGSLPADKLSVAYRSADAFILPTLLESFGRPYDEAMHFDLPILTSDRDFARERCRDAAIYFDPLDADSVARAMARVMKDVNLRQRLVENGRRVLAKSPSWDEIAAQFVEVLERTAREKEGNRQGGVGSTEWEGVGRVEAEGRKQKAVGGKQRLVGSGRQPESRGLVAVGSGSNLIDGFRPASSEVAPENERGQASLNSETGEKMASARPPHELNLTALALPSANCLLPTAYCLLPSADSLLPTPYSLHPSDDVRTLFNQKARSWRSKYGSRGTLNSRVEQFAERLAGLCRPPAGILDFGCGTGEIAAAMDRIGYQVTACDFAEEMIAVARSNYSETAVKWVRLESNWKVLPFPDGSFDGIVASSVFEYLDDLPRVAEELFRVLRPDGVLLLTVPNPHHVVRKIERRLRSMPLMDRTSHLLRRVQRLDSYASYLRLSKNRFAAQGWKYNLGAAHFVPVEENEFSDEAWQRQAQAPLVLLAVKKMADAENGQFDAETTLCRLVEK